MEKSLKFFEPGEKGIVMHIEGDGPVKRRLFDMGVTPGIEIEMKRLAPLGDPMEISLRGYILTLRKTEAEHIVMNVEVSNVIQSVDRAIRNRVRRGNNNLSVEKIIKVDEHEVIHEDLNCGTRNNKRRKRKGNG